MLLISPAEPKILQMVGVTSSVPESVGADFLIPSRYGLAGVQRKVIPDFIASVIDGRLHDGMTRLCDLPVKILLIEGRPTWTTDGQLLDRQGRHFSRGSWWGLQLSILERGIWVMHTGSIDETAVFLKYLETWLTKPNHRSLDTRPGPFTPWGRVSSRGWSLHLLQGFPGIGPDTAANIIDHFGGVPLEWSVSEKDLRQVDGVGKVRAAKLIEALKRTEEATDGQGK